MSAVGGTLAALRGAGAVLRRARPATLVLVSVAWMALIWWLSSRPSLDEQSTWVMGWLANGFHAPLYGLLALWALPVVDRARPWPRMSWPSVVAVLALVLAYGVVDEWHQSWVPGRDPNAFDVLTDLVGASCVLWITAYLGRATATEGGLRLRLVLGVALCGVAGALAMGA